MNIRFGSSEGPMLRFSANRRLNNAAVAVITLTGVLMLLGGILIWPYVFSWIGLDPARYANAEALQHMGRMQIWLSAGVTLSQLVAGSLIFWFSDSKSYSVARVGLSLFILGFLLYAIGAPVLGVEYVRMAVNNGIGAVFTILINSIIALLLTLLPTALVTALAHFARSLFSAWYRRAQRNIQ